MKNNICSVCHSNGTGCCVSHPSTGGTNPGLTSAEIDRICDATRLEPAAFTVRDNVSDEFLRILDAINPIMSMTMPNGNRIRLKLDGDRCILQGRDGCILPRGSRPCFCQLYPLFVDSDNKITVLNSYRCLAQRSSKDIDHVIGRMGTSRDKIFKIFAQLQDFARYDLERKKWQRKQKPRKQQRQKDLYKVHHQTHSVETTKSPSITS